MTEGGILDGDTVIIKKAERAENGEIVVALVENSEATLKIIRHHGETVELIPMNKNYQTRVLAAEDVKVQGVLSGLLRRYH